MKNLIGNPFKIFLKYSEKSINGILVDVDDLYDYIQDENSVCIIPKNNILYYKTNELSKSSKVIKSIEIEQNSQIKDTDKLISVFVDRQEIIQIKVPMNVESNELIGFIYSNEIIHNALHEKKQKKIECFDDAVYITTDRQVDIVSSPQISFSTNNGPINSYLNPSEMALRLNKSIKGGQKNE